MENPAKKLKELFQKITGSKKIYLSIIGVLLISLISFGVYKIIKYQNWKNMIPIVIGANFDLNYKKIPYNVKHIDIIFSTNLKNQDINNNFQIFPNISGKASIINGNTIRYKIDENMKIGKEYTIIISKGIQADNGKILEKDYNYMVQALAGVKATGITPQGNVENLNQNIVAFFNIPLIPLSSLENKDKTPCPIEIQPAIDGKCKWTTTSVVEYIPNGHLEGATDYKVKIKNVDGLFYPIDEEKIIDFSTPKLKINIPENFSPKDGLKIVFNFPIKNENLNDYIKLYEIGTGTEKKQINTVISQASQNPNEYIINPSEGKLTYSKSYNIIINKGISPLKGNKNLDEEYNRIVVANNFISNINFYQKIYSQTGSLIDTKFFEYSTGFDTDYYYKYLPNETIFQINLEEEISLDKSLFEFTDNNGKAVEFNISYVKEDEYSYENGKEQKKTVERKNKIKLEPQNNLENDKTYTLKLKKTSNQSLEKDIIKTYNTSPILKLIDFKYISYNKTCLYFNNPINSQDKLTYLDPKASNYQKINTEPASRIASFDYELTWQNDFMDQINDIKGDSGWDNLSKQQQKDLNILFEKNGQCPLYLHDNTYAFALNTRLNPNSEYKINITKQLEDKYGNNLDTDHSKTVKTGEIKEVDKYLYSSLNKTYNVIPSNLPITIDIQSINNSFAYIQVCQMDEKDYIDYLEKTYYGYNINYEPKCANTMTKKVNLKNSFWNLTNNRFDLEKDILGEKLTKNIVLVRGSVTQNFDPYLASNIKGYDNGNDYYSLFYKNSAFNKEFLNVYIRSNIFLGLEKAANKNVLFATDFGGENTIQGLKFEFYKYDGNKLNKFDQKIEFNKNTGSYEINGNFEGNLIFAKNGNSWGTILLDKDALANYDFGYIAGIGSTEKNFLYLYTERPLYKPGDTVYFKGLLRKFELDGYHKSGVKEGDLEILDENFSIIYSNKIHLDNNSNFTGEFNIPKDAPVGTYRFNFNINGESVMNNATFSIEEYVKPTFKININSQKNEYAYGESAKILVQPEYYFGGKMINTDGYYSILTQNYYFDPQNYSDYQFGTGYEYFNCLYWDNCTYNDNMLSYTGFSIDKDGNYSMNYKFEGDGTKGEKIYTFNYEVTDPDTQRTASNDLQIILHNTDGYVGIKNSYWNTKEKGINIEGVVLDWKSQPKPGSKILLQLIKQEWQSIKKQDVDGIFYNDYSLKETLESNKTITVGNNGMFNETLFSKDSGEYKILAIYTGTNSKSFKSATNAYVEGNGFVQWNNGNNDITKLVSDKQILNVGQTQEYTLQSPVNKGKALILIEKDDGILDYFVHNIKSFGDKISIPIKDSYYPNFYVKAILIGKNDGDQLPTYKRALSITKVNTDYKKLNIEIKTNKEYYKPGEQIEIQLNVKDQNSNPVPYANGSISIVDESLLALKGNPKQNPYAYFYDIKRYLGTLTYSSLKDLIERLEVKDMTHGEKGGDGDNLKGGNSKKKRGTFKDTAYWLANFTTDQNGNATIKTDNLPDNLTTWDIEAVINTPSDNKIGVTRAYVITNKKLMINENLPSFLGSNDEINIEPVIFNKTGKDQIIEVTIEATNAKIDNKKENIHIKNGEQKTVKFKLKIDDKLNESNDYSTINIKAQATQTQDSDEIEKLVTIKQNLTSESVSTIGKTDLVSFEEQIDMGGNQSNSTIEINYSATLLTSLLDGINYLTNYPYGCSEQKASSLMPNIFIKKLYDAAGEKFDFNEKTIKYWDENGEGYKTKTLTQVFNEFLVDINTFQNPDGGFTYWSTKDVFGENESDFELTSYIAISISKIKQAGFKVNEEKLAKAISYLKDRFYKNTISGCKGEKDFCKYSTTEKLNTLSALLDYDPNDYEVYKMWKLIDDNSTLNSINLQKALIMAKLININGITQPEKDKLKDQAIEIIKKIINNELVFNPRGAYIGKDSFYSRITNTAKLVEIISLLGKQNFENIDVTLDNMIRWILGQKKDGSFGSTQDTIQVINALTQYIIDGNELKNIDMNVKLSVNNKQIDEKNINKENKFNIFEKILNAKDLLLNNSFQISKTGVGTVYYDLNIKYFIPTEDIQARDEGMAIIRHYYDYNEYNKIKKLKQQEWEKYLNGEINIDQLKYPKEISEYIEPIDGGKIGQLIVVHNKIIIPETRDNIAFEGYIPSGSQLININLKSQSKQGIELMSNQENIFSKTEFRYDRFFGYTDILFPGIYEYDYVIRLTHAGIFNIKPSKIFEFYNEEIFGRTKGEIFEIK